MGGQWGHRHERSWWKNILGVGPRVTVYDGNVRRDAHLSTHNAGMNSHSFLDNGIDIG